MSLILKGIDLPSCSNEDCIVVIRKDKAEVWQTGFKERTVEAIQIPKDHGRLIEERYPGELQAKCPEGLFIMYHSADDDTNRFMFEAEAEK